MYRGRSGFRRRSFDLGNGQFATTTDWRSTADFAFIVDLDPVIATTLRVADHPHATISNDKVSYRVRVLLVLASIAQLRLFGREVQRGLDARKVEDDRRCQPDIDVLGQEVGLVVPSRQFVDIKPEKALTLIGIGPCRGVIGDFVPFVWSAARCWPDAYPVPDRGVSKELGQNMDAGWDEGLERNDCRGNLSRRYRGFANFSARGYCGALTSHVVREYCNQT